MPKPLSRIQLLWTRLLAPPAPAAASAPTRIARSTSLGNAPKLVTTAVVSSNAVALIAANSAITMNTRIAPTLTNSSRSTVWYTTGELVSVIPMASSAATAITVASPPPNANVATVAAPVAHPGHEVASSAIRTSARPHGFHSRWKPVIAVCPVASV
jgi:hypothetical protein